EMENDVESGKIIIGIDVSDKENIKLIQSKNNENVNKSQWAVISAQNYLKKWITGLKENYFETEQKKVTSGRIQGNNLDYVLTGVIAFSILTGGMFSVIRVFGNYRKLGVIKRFMVAPVKPWEFVLSASVNKIILNLFSVIIIIFLGKIMYNLNYDFNWFLMLFVSVSATLGMMAVGILFLLLFKQTESASNAASLFSTAMTFFAGIYFPISFLPNFLQWIAYILPIKYIGDMIRYCAGIEEMKLSVFYGLNFTFIIVGIIFLVYASKKFVAKEN
ncbi:MAG TPA: ABC transporter permease, partial [Tepiditoga sp.]|nr:ABC transporter permease [Tepiditoga sp.]